MSNLPRITDVKVDWMDRFANSPRFMVTMSPEPDHVQLVYDERREGPNTAYLATQGDYASFMFHVASNETGYGGRVFPLMLSDGRVRMVKGPWSSNAADMTEAFNVPLVDVVINEHTSGAVLAAPLIAACKERGIEVAWVQCGSWIDLQPLRNGAPKNPKDKIVEAC